MSSFEIDQNLFQIIKQAKNIHLSLAQYHPISSKDVVSGRHTKAGRLSPREHLDQLVRSDRLRDLNCPLIVISIRNVLSNLRCVAYLLKENENKPLAVKDEIFSPQRPYHIIGMKEAGLVMENFTPGAGLENEFNWFFSGVPVLWEGRNEETLYQGIVAESSDHSHVWKIPRGSHPKATEKTREHWENLHEIYMKSLELSTFEASQRLLAYAETHQLEREDNYLHNVLGINDDGHLIQYIGKGRMEKLGEKLRQKGATKGIIVDNSGSSTVYYYAKGYNSNCPVQLFAAPNHRVAGTAYLVIELQDGVYSSLF